MNLADPESWDMFSSEIFFFSNGNNFCKFVDNAYEFYHFLWEQHHCTCGKIINYFQKFRKIFSYYFNLLIGSSYTVAGFVYLWFKCKMTCKYYIQQTVTCVLMHLSLENWSAVCTMTLARSDCCFNMHLHIKRWECEVVVNWKAERCDRI